MGNIDDIANKLQEASNIIKEAFKISFDSLNQNPHLKKEIVDQWKNYINNFLRYTVEVSENGKNNELSKAITKALIFNKK